MMTGKEAHAIHLTGFQMGRDEEKQRIIQLLVDSQRLPVSDVWQWNGTEFVTSLGNIIALIKGENQ